MCNRQRWTHFILWSQLMYQKAYWKRHLVWSSTMSSSSQVYNVYTIQYVPFFLDFNYKKVRKSSKLINLILIWIWMYNFNFCLNLKYLIIELKLMIKHGSFTKINKHKCRVTVFGPSPLQWICREWGQKLGSDEATTCFGEERHTESGSPTSQVEGTPRSRTAMRQSLSITQEPLSCF